MPKLIDRNGLRADRWVRFNGDAAALAPDAAVLLPLDAWREYQAQWAAHQGPIGILLAPSDDPQTIAGDLARLSLIAVEFPSFTDGRGYSIGRLLRQRYRWQGELRAVGDILRDQLFYLARCGFDTFELRDDQRVETALTAFADFTEVYQTAADRTALFERRPLVNLAADSSTHQLVEIDS